MCLPRPLPKPGCAPDVPALREQWKMSGGGLGRELRLGGKTGREQSVHCVWAGAGLRFFWLNPGEFQPPNSLGLPQSQHLFPPPPPAQLSGCYGAAGLHTRGEPFEGWGGCSQEFAAGMARGAGGSAALLPPMSGLPTHWHQAAGGSCQSRGLRLPADCGFVPPPRPLLPGGELAGDGTRAGGGHPWESGHQLSHWLLSWLCLCRGA